VEIVAFAPIKV